jgi:hypothetical protein
MEERERVTQLWLKAQEPLKGVLVTRALPPLTWLPNEHNDLTMAMAAAQRRAVEEAMQARVDEDTDFFEQVRRSYHQCFLVFVPCHILAAHCATAIPCAQLRSLARTWTQSRSTSSAKVSFACAPSLRSWHVCNRRRQS